MTLPPEAIEAAAKAIHDLRHNDFDRKDGEWVKVPYPITECGECKEDRFGRSLTTETDTTALTAALPFLVPTREQIAQAIFDSPTGEDWYACQEAADAVLALFGGATNE